MALDPLTVARLWLLFRPGRRIKLALYRHKIRQASKRGEIIDMDFLKKEADVNYSQVEAIIRHVLTTAGGSLVAAGYVNDAQLTALIGGLLALGGIVWSVVQKRKPAP